MSIVLPKDRKKFHLFATHPQWSTLPPHILDQIYHYLKVPLSSCHVVVKKERHSSFFPRGEGLYSASSYCMRLLAPPKNSYWDARLSESSFWVSGCTKEKLLTRGQKQQKKHYAKKTKSQTRRHFNAKNPKIQNRKR
jgi:hypothetical protein